MVDSQAVWGQHSAVEALRLLLSAALKDPGNQRFQVLGDGSLPLYPPPAVYLRLMRQTRSHVNACQPTTPVRFLISSLDFPVGSLRRSRTFMPGGAAGLLCSTYMLM